MGMSHGQSQFRARAPQTHVIRRCAVDNLRLAGYSSCVHTCGCPVLVLELSRAITGAANVATFPRHLMVEYGVPASEAYTVIARSQAVRGWGTAWHGNEARRDRMSHINTIYTHVCIYMENRNWGVMVNCEHV